MLPVRVHRFLGVGSSNRKNQWQARILYHGKVTHLGYYRTEEEAARVYDKVSISLHGAGAQTNFPIDQVGVCCSWIHTFVVQRSTWSFGLDFGMFVVGQGERAQLSCRHAAVPCRLV